MKKLLSILAIGTILTSFSPTIVACNAKKTTFSLDNLAIYNLNVFNPNNQGTALEVNNYSIYKEIENQIINLYNNLNFKTKLTWNNFVCGDFNALKKDKSWAIQVYNIDNTKILDNDKNTPLLLNRNYSVLEDNALVIKVYTNDKNVVSTNNLNNDINIKSAQIKGYLNKFIFTTANANRGNDIDIFAVDGKAQLDQENVNDVSGIPNPLSLVQNDPIAPIKQALSDNVVISKIIINNLNNQLKNETKTLNSKNILPIRKDSNPLIINPNSIKLYRADGASTPEELVGPNLPNQNGDKIFAQIRLDGLKNYIGIPYSACYLYLGMSVQRHQ